jgi:hypothetical protein
MTTAAPFAALATIQRVFTEAKRVAAARLLLHGGLWTRDARHVGQPGEDGVAELMLQ